MSADDIANARAKPPIVKFPDGSRAVARPGTVRIRSKPQPRQLDIAFVFDTTGSMSDKIDGLVRCMDDLVTELGRMQLDWRITTVPFGDLTVPGDRIVADRPFVTSVSAASTQLRSMPRFWGGANLGESSVEAMVKACDKRYRPNAVKALILITDEPALGHAQGTAAVHNALYALDAICFTVAPDRLPYYKDWATAHGGEWREVGLAVDTTAIITLFKSLIVRMVAIVDSVHRLGSGSVRAYLDRARDDS